MKRTNFAKLTELLAKKSLLAMAFVCGFLLLGSDASAQMSLAAPVPGYGISFKTYLNGQTPVTENQAITKLTVECKNLADALQSGNQNLDEGYTQVKLEYYRHILNGIQAEGLKVPEATAKNFPQMAVRHSEFSVISKSAVDIFKEAVDFLAN